MEAETRNTPLPISSIRFIANATGGLVPVLTTKLKDRNNRAIIINLILHDGVYDEATR
jgi:hypothetical protein